MPKQTKQQQIDQMEKQLRLGFEQYEELKTQSNAYRVEADKNKILLQSRDREIDWLKRLVQNLTEILMRKS